MIHPDPLLLKLGHQVLVRIEGLADLPCHVGYRLRAGHLGADWSTRGLTTDLAVAVKWIDNGGFVNLCKVWQFLDGALVDSNPATFIPHFAWRPHVIGSARP